MPETARTSQKHAEGISYGVAISPMINQADCRGSLILQHSVLLDGGDLVFYNQAPWNHVHGTTGSLKLRGVLWCIRALLDNYK